MISTLLLSVPAKGLLVGSPVLASVQETAYLEVKLGQSCLSAASDLGKYPVGSGEEIPSAHMEHHGHPPTQDCGRDGVLEER